MADHADGPAQIGAQLLAALMAWQQERDWTNSAMAERIGITEAYWKAIRIGRRPLTLEVARLVGHRFDQPHELVIRLLAREVRDAWFADVPSPDAEAVGAEVGPRLAEVG